MRTIAGDEARSLIESQLAAHGNGVLSFLAQYRCEDAVAAWHETVRAVEEFINLPKFGISDDRLRAWLCAIRLDGAFVSDPGPTWSAVRQALGAHLEPTVIARFTRIMLYARAMGEAFAAHGHDARSAGITLATIGEDDDAITGAVLSDLLEKRRGVWTERFLLMALWARAAKSKNEGRYLRITTKAPGYNGIMAPGIPE